MLYHTIIVHLFRPMLKVDLIHSDVHPRDICIEAANTVSNIVRTYRQLYDFRVAHLIIPHCLLSVCIVHLLYSKDNGTSYTNLVAGLQGLEDLHECHYFGARSFRIIHTLATTWNLPWPEELRNSTLIPQAILSLTPDPLLITPNTLPTTGTGVHRTRPNPNVPYPPISHPSRRESLSMFAPAQTNTTLHLATHPAITRPPSVTHNHNHNTPFSPYAPSTTSATAEQLFWNPIPGMPGPILPRGNYTGMGAMGLESVLAGDRLGRDGFKMSEEWQGSGFTGAGGTGNGFTGAGEPNNGFRGQGGTGYAVRGGTGFEGQGQSGESGAGFEGQSHGQGEGGYEGAWYGGQMS